MTRRYWLFLCCCLCYMYSGYAYAQHIPIQPKVKQFLGTNASAILAEATSIEVFLLEPLPSAGGEQFNGFKVLKRSLLTPENSIAIKKILGTDAHYGFDNLMKNCIFTPSLGLRFHHNGQTLDVLINTDCNVWRFVGNQLNKTEDFDPAQKQVKDFLQMAFAKP